MGILNVDKLNITSGKFKVNVVANAAARDALTGMSRGSLVYTLEDEVLEFYDGSAWTQMYKPKVDLLYDFTSATFYSNVSRGERSGPSYSTQQAAFGSYNWFNSYYGTGAYTGYFRWTVPGTAVYRIEAGGGRGGRDNCYGISDIWGASIRGEFNLEQGEVLEMVCGVGGNQYCSPHGNEAGGGGGTFVRNYSTGSLLLAAGGGGGSAGNVYGNSCSRDLNTASGQNTQQSGITTCQGNYTAATPTIGYGGFGNGSYWGHPGAGYLGNGNSGYTHCGVGSVPQAYENGAEGGRGDVCYTGSGEGNRGGFGGGGGGNLSGGGGAGGYTGGCSSGAWSSYSQHGGGGGSYNGGTNQINTRGGNSGTVGPYAGAGYVTITILE